MKKLFLSNVGTIGDLTYRKILYEYEEIPICFVCEDARQHYYLVHCSEIREKQRWIITPCAIKTLKLLVDRDMSLFSALTQNKDVTIVEKKDFENDFSCKKELCSVISPFDLPDEDIYLEDFEIEILSKFIMPMFYERKLF